MAGSSDVESLSPCVNVCELDTDFVCKGCGRSIEEILKWQEYTIEQQTAVLDRIFGEAGNGTDCHT